MTGENKQPDDHYFMGLALEQAAGAEREDEVPVGCVVVVDGAVIGSGRNRPIATADPTAHAEIEALRDACRRTGNYRLGDATLYVTVEPCAMCAGACVQARIARLVFGCRDPKAGAAGSLYSIPTDPRLNHRIAVEGGVRSDEAAAMIEGFFRRRRRPARPADIARD